MNLAYTGKTSQVFKIWLGNLFLQIITLGIYRPWAKVKMRRYLYRNILVFGDSLEYSGTGKELLKGSAKALLLVVVLPVIAVSILAAIIFSFLGVTNTDDLLDGVVNLAYFIFFGVLIWYAQFAALRSRLNRSRWRSIRARLDGKAKSYVFFRFGRFLLNIITLGFAIGRSDLLSRKYLIDRISIGSNKFTFDGDHKALDGANFGSLLLAIPTLFLSRLWYANKRRNYFWNSIKVTDEIHFSADFSFRSSLGLLLSNLLLIIVTLGFAIPYCLNRSVKFLVDHIQIHGDPKGVKFLQSHQNSRLTADALESMMESSDIDFDLGIW